VYLLLNKYYRVLAGHLKTRDHQKDLGTYGSIILNWILKKQERRVWVHLVQDRDQGWALVYLVMNLWVP
jgi:hypothetical protein